MAQIGCFVSAENCKLTIVDRVFTRIGASDRILENKSTFFVELEETKTIVEQATKNSLVIMDELGRGTSTFDGYSIAHSVLRYLALKTQVRDIFN
jgi:DNA mismatch repair protein MSH6